MGKFFSRVFCILISNLTLLNAQTCKNYAFRSNAVYATCVSLPVLNSNLHWNYYANGTVDLAFRHTGSSTSQWIAWALNVGGSGMVGAQSLVALTSSNGRSVQAYTSAVSGYATGLQPTTLSFDVPRITAERVNGDVVIYATLVLPSGRTSFNHVWQVGPVTNGAPIIHPMGSDNRASVGTVDFISGQASAGGNVGRSWLRGRNAHGVLNAINWGVMMPMGVVTARYLKVFESANRASLYIHIGCKTSAYIGGVAGWATEPNLVSDSTSITYDSHRNIGNILFALGTLQVSALLLWPKPDHEYRFYWNIYHNALGYGVISLSIVNVYKGLDILEPEKKWKNAYTAILISLGAVALLLEGFTWFIVFKRKQEDKKMEKRLYRYHGLKVKQD